MSDVHCVSGWLSYQKLRNVRLICSWFIMSVRFWCLYVRIMIQFLTVWPHPFFFLNSRPLSVWMVSGRWGKVYWTNSIICFGNQYICSEGPGLLEETWSHVVKAAECCCGELGSCWSFHHNQDVFLIFWVMILTSLELWRWIN